MRKNGAHWTFKRVSFGQRLIVLFNVEGLDITANSTLRHVRGMLSLTKMCRWGTDMLLHQTSEPFASHFESETRPTQSTPVYGEIVDRAAQALFEFVFAGCARLDGKHRWTNCDESTRQAFRSEATIVIEAVWPSLATNSEKFI